jgi:hypothetical protein
LGRDAGFLASIGRETEEGATRGSRANTASTTFLVSHKRVRIIIASAI